MSRVTKKPLNWFLRGWEYRDTPGQDGRTHRTLVYTGEYYRLNMDEKSRRAAKWLAGAVYVLLCAVYLAFETTLTQGGFVWYAGAPCLLAILPLFYLGLGVFNLAAAEKRFTYRRMRAIFTRIRIGGKLAALLLGLGGVGQTVFVLRYGRLLALGPELFMLFGAWFCALCAAALTVLARRLPCEELPQT